MQSHNFYCQICYRPFNQEERIPKICPCGHTLCLYCLDQHFGIQSKCPFCRFDMRAFRQNADLVTTNRALMELIEDKCPFHSELRTLICLTCKHEVCSACVFLDKSHPHHKIIHKNQIFLQKEETKGMLWSILDERRRFRKAITLLLQNTKEIAIKKLIKLKYIADKKIEEAIVQETQLFFALKEDKVEKVLENVEESIQFLQEQISILYNSSIDEQVLEILGNEQAESGAKEQYQLLLNDMMNFNQFLDRTIEFTLLLDSIQNSQAAVALSDEKAFLNIMKLLNFDFKCDALVVSQKNMNTDIDKDDLSVAVLRQRTANKSENMYIPFKSAQSPKEIAGITLRILDLFRTKSHALMDLLTPKIDTKTPLSLWSLKFWLQGVMVFEMNLCGCQISYDEIESLFRKVMPQLTTLQEINLDFKEANMEDEALQTFENNTLRNLKKLQVCKFNLDGTRVTNRGITWVLKNIMETKQDFSVLFGSEKVLSKDLDRIIYEHFKDLPTSFEVYLLNEHPQDTLSTGQPTEGTTTVMSLLNEDNELAIGVEFMCERHVSEYVEPSEESRYKFVILKLSSQQDRTISNSGVSTAHSEVQFESTRLDNENP